MILSFKLMSSGLYKFTNKKKNLQTKIMHELSEYGVKSDILCNVSRKKVRSLT